MINSMTMIRNRYQILFDIEDNIKAVLNSDNKHAEYELALFSPNAIFDNFDEKANDKPTEIGVTGAQKLFKR